MSLKFVAVDEALQRYILEHTTPEDALLQELRAETQRLFSSQASMQIAPEQGALMTLLVRISGARELLEVGTFTGTSAVCLARGLPPDGRLLAFDLSREYTDVARRFWERAGLAQRIELRLGPALEGLRGLPREERFDLAFVDADKGGYLSYHQEIVPRLRPGGLLLADNTLWSGQVARPEVQDQDTQALRRFNDAVRDDARLESVLLPVADGLLLARKRS